MKIPTVFFQNTSFADPLSSVILKAEACVAMKRGLSQRTIYDDIIRYINLELKHIKKIVFGEDWIKAKVFTTSVHENQYISNMIGVYPQHDKNSLFVFAREISAIIHLQGFKDDIVDYILSKIMVDIPKRLSKKYRVKKNEDNYIITKK